MSSASITWLGTTLAAALLAVGGSAHADDGYAADPDPYRSRPIWGYAEAALLLGGGVQGFTDGDMTDTTDIGGGWDLRLQLGTRTPISLEAAYIGSAQRLDTFGVGDDAVLVGNGAEIAARLNFIPDMPWQPYAFVGAAWRRYDVTNTDTNLSDVEDSDDVWELPVGAGIAYRMNQFVFDLRGQFRPAFDNDLVPEDDVGRIDGRELHRWGVDAKIGVEF